MTTEEFRRRLCGLVDPQEQLGLEAKETQRLLAIQFVATLPELFGEELDRMTLWDRIASGIESAYAKTPGEDVGFFVQECLTHIKASASATARNARLSEVVMRLNDATAEERQAWMVYLKTHLLEALIYARQEWEQRKEERAAERKEAQRA